MRLKIILIVFSFLIFESTYSQINVNVQQNSLGLDYMIRDFVTLTTLNGDLNNDTKVLGSFFLFDTWVNNCKVQIKGKEFKLNKVNLNVQTNEFMLEMGKDSIFTFTTKSIDFININDKKYKYHFYKNENKFFEVLLEGKEENISILKGYHIRIIPKSNMGMLNRPYDKITKDQKFYTRKGTEIKLLKLKKKEVLGLIDSELQNDIKKYIKKNKLSYKKEKDLVEIFKYYNSL